MKKPPEGELTK